jgi:hypothetical protein
VEPRPVFDPNTPSVARTYDYLIRAVTFMVGELGIDQFIDLGSGLPTADNVHQVAQQADPELRGLIDLDRPVAVTASAILHHVLDSDDPLGVIRAYTAATPFGSCLFVSHFRTLADPESAGVSGGPTSRSRSTSAACGWSSRGSRRAPSGGRTPAPASSPPTSASSRPASAARNTAGPRLDKPLA